MHTIKHAKTSTIADAPNDDLVRPSDWNNTHSINWGVATPNVRTFDASMASGGDPYYNNVELLIKSNDIDGSSTFVDSSPKARAISTAGTITHENNYAKFGVTSIRSAGGRLTVNTPVLTDCTFEMWILPKVIAGVGVLVRADYGGDWSNLAFGDTTYTFGVNTGIAGNTLLSVDQWHYVAETRTGNIGRLYVNGVKVWQGTVGTGGAACPMQFLGAHDIGRLDCYAQDIRVSSVARYIGDSHEVPTTAAAMTLPGITLPDNQNYMSIGPITIDGVDVNVPNNCDWVIM